MSQVWKSKSCHAADIRVVMITGDCPGTAQKIARQAGLPLGQVMTGSELDELSNADLRQKIQQVNIFTRAVPEQKLRIVQALKANGEIVAMTGDAGRLGMGADGKPWTDQRQGS